LPGEVGEAGRITIDGGRVFLAVDSHVTTEAREAAGGNIEIFAREKVELVGSEVSTSVLGGPGGGGDIDIGVTAKPRFVIVNGSLVKANADVDNGGNIQITADNFLISADSVLSATSNLALDGVIVVDAPENELVDGVSQLSDTFLDVDALLTAHCAARAEGRGSFVVRGRDGLPESPDRALPSRSPGAVTVGRSDRPIPEAAQQLADLDCSGRADFARGAPR
jgi:hypothetical protein